MIEDLSVGDQLPVYVTNTSSYNNELLVSIEKGQEQLDWDQAKDFLADGETLEVEVTGFNKGGLLVAVGRLTGFIPNSMIPNLPRGLSREDRQKTKSGMVGKAIQANIIEVDQPRKQLVLSGRATEDAIRKQRLQELKEGEKVTGIVSNVVDFGAFVDLGGINGLIHISRLAWEEIEHPSAMVQPGDEVEVMIRNVDLDRERVSLDRRALIPGPWEDFAREHHPGDMIEGEVVSVRDFGIFVRLTEQITGLLHVSELLPGITSEMKDALHPGDTVLVRILSIEPELERVSLSMRRVQQAENTNWVFEQRLNVGSRLD